MAVCDGLTDVSTEARRLAAVASVLGAAFSIDDAGEVLGEPVGRLLPWIAEIVDAGIVVAEAEAFAFIDDATRNYPSLDKAKGNIGQLLTLVQQDGSSLLSCILLSIRLIYVAVALCRQNVASSVQISK